MNEQNEPFDPRNNASTGLRPFAWLLLAFVPSVIGVLSLQIKNASPIWGILLVMLAVACCCASGIGLLSKMENRGLGIFLGLLLGAGFFVLNVIIVIFVGCSGMGRISP